MISNRKELARQALSAALKARVKAEKNLWDPICVYDVTEKLQVDIRFLDVPSMEGFYSKQPGPLILLPSERPASRLAFSCAHELGHHVFGHGTRADELLAGREEDAGYSDDPEEFLVDCFAGFLLMPKLAVDRAMTYRGWKMADLTAEQAYTIAGLHGVGYTTLLKHLRWSLGVLSATKAAELLKIQPKQIRSTWLGHETTANIVVVDRFWIGRPIDVRVGDFIVAPYDLDVEFNGLRFVRNAPLGVILEAVHPGIGRLSAAAKGWASFVRVSRSAFVGLAKYRHLEDPSDA